MIHYNGYDIDGYKYMVEILEKIGGTEPDDEEVWEIAREYEEVPCFENILWDLLLSNIKKHTEEQYPDVPASFYVNAHDTHLYINGETVIDYDGYTEAIGRFLSENDKK